MDCAPAAPLPSAMVRVQRREPTLQAPFPLAAAQNSSMGARAPNAAPFNHGTGACDSHAPPRHAPRSKRAAVTTRRPHTRAGSSPLPPDREEAVGLRRGKANPKTPTFFARFDPVFPRDSSGRSILVPIKEESTSLATSPLSSKRTNGHEPPRARSIFPPARAPLKKTPTRSTGLASSLGTLTHVPQATSAPVVQERYPIMRNGPMVTPRPPARMLDAIPVIIWKNRAFRQPEAVPGPLPLRVQRELFLDILRQRATRPRREHPWVRTHVALSRPGVPGGGRHGPEVPRASVPRRRHCRPIFLRRPPTGWHRQLLTLLSNTPQTEWCCSGNRRLTVRSDLLRRLSWTTYHILARSSI